LGRHPYNKIGYASIVTNEETEEERFYLSSLFSQDPYKLSNNVSEYLGLLSILEYFDELGVKLTADIYGDSDMVIKQMQGIYKVTDDPKKVYGPYGHKALEIKKRLEKRGCKLNFYWIPREKNQRTDDLSKDALQLDSELVKIYSK
jgi:ribonuclease HI